MNSTKNSYYYMVKSSITSKINKVNSLSTEFPKNLNSVNKSNSIDNVNNIPFENLKADNKQESRSNVADESSNKFNNITNKSSIKPGNSFKSKKVKQSTDVVLIDLTDETVTKIVKVKKRRKISWLEEAKRNYDAKIKKTALKIDEDNINSSLKISNEDTENTSQKPHDSSNFQTAELESKLSDPISNPIVEPQNKSNKRIDSVELKIKEANSSSSPPDSSTSKFVCCNSDSIPDDLDDKINPILEAESIITDRLDSIIDSSSIATRLDEEKAEISALCKADVLSKEKQPADSTVSNIETPKEISSSTEDEKITTAVKDSYSTMKKSSTSIATAIPVVENKEPTKIIANSPVNSSKTKTDYNLNKQKVQQALITRKSNTSIINEIQTNVLEKKEKENNKVENNNVNSENNEAASDLIQISDIKRTKRNNDVNSSSKQLQADSSEQPTTVNGFYGIQESDLDGLTLLASVSARQLTANKKTELKVKPYSSLQEKSKDIDKSSVVDHVVGICPEDALDKVALQVEVSSTELVSSTVNKNQQNQETSSELFSYILDESVQNNLETNGNANVILNGETIMLLQKSPNSNLYIINKAAVDNIGNSKINYNSDDEDGNKPVESEDIKCQQGLMVKHDPDDVNLRGRAIKPDPDYVDVKSSVYVHDEMKHHNQPPGYELHYAGYPVLPGTYCTYPNIHHPSTGCACVNCAYCHQSTYYLPATHATQSVQTNPTVQDKRSSKKTEATAMLAKLYDDQLLCSIEKGFLDSKQQKQQEQIEEIDKEVISRYRHVDSKLPLKKRLKAQRMMSIDFENQSTKLTSNDKVEPTTYPGTLMMSIADVDVQNDNPHLDLGAVVEVTSATVKPTKSRDRNERMADIKVNNQNVPNCFPRKSNGKKKRLGLTDEEVENSSISALKKSRKSNGVGVKQTRSSRRVVPMVKYVYPEIDPEWNPSGKRKRKKNNR